MFQGTVSLWRRLTGAAATSLSEAVNEDRRVSVRHFPPENIHLRVANADDGSTIVARVQSLSHRGIGLITPQRFDAGSMLRVDVADAASSRTQTLLACVIHSTEVDDAWLVGCIWSGELTNAELEAFGVRGLKTETTDHRAWQRIPVELAATFRPATSEHDDAVPAQVLDLAPSGIGLLSRERVDAGQLISVELHYTNRPNVFSILACVVHVTARGDDWVLGCNFIRSLGEQDMQALA